MLVREAFLSSADLKSNLKIRDNKEELENVGSWWGSSWGHKPSESKQNIFSIYISSI